MLSENNKSVWIWRLIAQMRCSNEMHAFRHIWKAEHFLENNYYLLSEVIGRMKWDTRYFVDITVTLLRSFLFSTKVQKLSIGTKD